MNISTGMHLRRASRSVPIRWLVLAICGLAIGLGAWALCAYREVSDVGRTVALPDGSTLRLVRVAFTSGTFDYGFVRGGW